MKSPYNQLQHTHFQHTFLVLFLSFLLLLPTAALAQFTSAPAFPGAEGHGRYTTGGRGGTVVHVTNLNDSGTGSFRAAVTGGSNRIIVFDVAGVIELESDIKMKDNLTILGQTAPGDGITLRYYTVQPGGNNIIRFIRFRRGNDRDKNDGADATWQRQKSNIILDHCSFSWSIDEVASYYDNKDFTMQWCTIGEPLKHSGHEKGPHGYGGIWGGKGASFHHNLLIHLDNRAPRLNGARFFWKGPNGTEYPDVESCIAAEKVDLRNCVIYNTGTGNGAYGGMGGNHNIVNNYYKAGPATNNKKRVFQCSVSNSSDGTGTKHADYPGGIWGKFYIKGNYVTAAGSSATNYDWSGVTIDKCNDTGVTTPTADQLKIPQVETGSITTHTAEVAYEKVLSYAGASKSRDCIDTRYAREVRNDNPECVGSATSYIKDGKTYTISSHPKGIIDVTADALLPHSGVYTLSAGTPIVDTDGDGIPDEWETANGLNPNSASDANLYTIDNVSNGGKGYYTNIEVYANSLVEDIMKNENKDAQTTFDEYYPSITSTGGDDPAPTLYTVTYNTNSHGTCSIESWTQTNAEQSTNLPSVTAASGYTFLGWATTSSATSVQYNAGDNYTPTNNITLYAVYQQSGGSTEEFHAITSAEETILLTKANIEANNYLSVGTNDWNTGKTYGGVSGDFYNMSSSGRTITIRLADCRKVKLTVQNSTNGRTYSYSINGGDAVTVTHGGSGAETTSEIEVPSGNVTIVLKGGGSSVYPISITAYKGTTPTTYTVSATATNGSVVIKNGSTTVASGSAVDNGTSLTFTATPATGYKFTQWSDGNTQNPRTVVVNGAAVSLTAQFAAKSTDATLSALAAGSYALSPAFSANTTSYTCELPAGTSVVPTVTATKNNANASVNITQASSTTGTATITVTAESGATKTYTIQFSVASSGEQTTLFSMEVTSSNTLSLDYQKSSSLADYATIEGGSATVYNGKNSETAQNMVSSKAVNLGGSSGSYLQISLTNGKTFAAGDVITITNAGKWNVSKTNSGATSITTPYTVKTTDAFVGGNTLYIFKTGTSGDPSSIKSITITRGSNSGETPDDDDVIEDPDPEPVAVMPAAKKGYDFVVGKNGTIDEAIAAANADKGSGRYLIFVPNGTHNMTATQSWTLGSDKSAITGIDGTTVQPGATFSNNATWLERSNVSIIGQSMDGTILKNKPNFPGISYTSTLEIRGGKTNTYIQDLTLYNNYADGANNKGVAVAFYDRGTNTIAKNLNAWSNQDTYTSAATRCYYETSTFAGTVDFICGSGDVWFEQCDLVINDRSGNVITAPSTLSKEDWGYVFNHCTISKAEGATLVTDKNWNLGRPWKEAPASTFINTKMNVLPKDAAWTNMNDGLAIRFHEYGSTNSSGTLLDLSQRSVSACKGAKADKPVLTEAQASKYKVSNVLAGDTNWDPRALTLQVGVNNVQLDGNTLSWEDNDYALCWVVFKDGEYYANPITNSLTLNDYGTYTVRAANSMGGLGETSAAVVYEAEKAAVLVHTGSTTCGTDNTVVTYTIDAEKEHYNNEGSGTWQGYAFAQFDITVPSGKQVKSASLTWKASTTPSTNRQTIIYCLNEGETVNFNAIAEKTAGLLRKNTVKTEVYSESWMGERTVTTDVTNAVKALASTNATSSVYFQWTANPGGADLYGKASSDAPTLDVEFEDIPATDIIWDFSEYTTQVTLNSSLNNTYSTEYTKDGMTLSIVGNSGNSYENDYVKNTTGFHCNGASTSTIRYIKFTPTVDGVWKVTGTGNGKSLTRIVAIGTSITPFNSINAMPTGVLAAGETSNGTSALTTTIEAYLKAGATYYAYFAEGGSSITKVEFNTALPLALSEGNNYTSFTEGTYNVKLKKKFPASKWTSLVLPFSATTEQLKAAFPNEAANTEIAVVKEMKNNIVYFTTQAHIDANVPVLIKVGDLSADNTYTFTGVTVKNSSAPNSTAKDGIMMKGLYKKTGYNDGQVYTDRQHLYFVAQSKFYDWSYLSYMPPFSAYIYTDADNNVTNAKAITFMLGDDEATGVYTVNGYTTVEDDAAEYNAVGQRIGRTTKGLHISKGKKYFVK